MDTIRLLRKTGITVLALYSLCTTTPAFSNTVYIVQPGDTSVSYTHLTLPTILLV